MFNTSGGNMQLFSRKIGFIILALGLFSGHAYGELKTVPFVDLGQYAGRWYQISNIPSQMDAGCHCTQQTLTLIQQSDKIRVFNSCNRGAVDGPFTSITGEALNVDKQTNARFTVDFGSQVKGDYWIIALDEQYRWAVVSEPTMKSVYILSKTPALAPELYQAAVDAAAQQVDTSKLEMTVHEGCTYPQ